MLIDRRSVVLLGSAAMVASRAAAAETDDNRGPFGLVYGSSTDEVKQSGVQLSPLEQKTDYGETFRATGLSKVLSDMDAPALSFGFKNRLWRVAVPGRTISSDPFGSGVLARCEELKSSLSQRYGRGAETDIRDHEMWKNANEYIMSIKQGRATRFTSFSTRAANIELSIRALDDDSAYYLIIYASNVEERAFNLDKRVHENSAL